MVTDYAEWLRQHPEAFDNAVGNSEVESLLGQLENTYFTFKPRPDRPELHDQQASFINSKSTGVIWHIGGNASGTTTASLIKMARFLLAEQPPPRKNTPFWLISDTYDRTSKVWAEKICGQGIIPPGEIDWDGIYWYKSKLDQPLSVPLLPWPDHPGRNWLLEFKSCEQGRSKFQAEAIGGFLFMEQFPFNILIEVVRGCREYNFPGSKICEFTPIDPSLSLEIEQMIEDNSLPPGWEVYRANTFCNRENLAPGWYEEFLQTVPPEMQETRLTGAFASYEGAIYTTFNPAVHVRSDFGPPFPEGCTHVRAIDWGFTPDHKFACVWGYRDGIGTWWIYDEYLNCTASTLDDHLKSIMDKWPMAPGGNGWGSVYGDPSRPDCINKANQMGLNMMAACNSQLPGIECLQTHLKHRPAHNEAPPQPPRIFIHKKCQNLIRYLRAYRWKPRRKAPGAPLPPAEPLKKDDDLCDALRYLLFSEQQYNGLTPSSMQRKPSAAERAGVWGAASKGRR